MKNILNALKTAYVVVAASVAFVLALALATLIIRSLYIIVKWVWTV